jgi:hypothetical protein
MVDVSEKFNLQPRVKNATFLFLDSIIIKKTCKLTMNIWKKDGWTKMEKLNIRMQDRRIILISLKNCIHLVFYFLKKNQQVGVK